MSKARELAQAVISMMSDSQGVAGFHMNGDIASWGEYQELEELANAVLSEPEPLRGWIEIGEKPYRQLVSTTHDKVITEGVVPFDYVNKGDPCIRIHKLGEGIDSGLKSLESYDSIKQKIKESQ